jgi:ABC-2 type transport system permease protein
MALLPLVVPVLFVSQALMPTLFMSDWLKLSVDLNPFSHIVAAASTLMYGEFDPGLIVKAVAVAVGMFVILQIPVQLVTRRKIGK